MATRWVSICDYAATLGMEAARWTRGVRGCSMAPAARDWGPKGMALRGASAMIARSFERIHRSNLVALGILPIEVRGEGDLCADIGADSDVEILALKATLRPAAQIPQLQGVA